MPTECERSETSPTTSSNKTNPISSIAEIKENLTLTNLNEDLTSTTTTTTTTMEGDQQMSTSQTSTTSNGSSTCNGGRKTSITSPDPTAYVAKARVTRPTPPPPPYNPMQFVQIKPCNLYQTAQEQLKKAEEVKKIKEIRKEEPEDWQNNLDNWKSSRRKRVEHIIDRVVEVKKLELEEHDRTRRKSKTFSEMMEERGERSGGRGLNKLASLAVYTEDEANDLSDLGIGTSSASGKSSLSEDYDNNSVMSDNAAELDKAINNSTHNNNNNSSSNKNAITDSTTREYISSPGYETSSSTAPASSPDPCEYTYEGAIQDYKQRVSRAASGLTSVALNKLSSQQQQINSKESTPERPLNKETAYPPRRGSKIEDRLMGFEVQSPSEECVEKNTKVDVPKIDISKRKEIFESANESEQQPKSQVSTGGVPRVTLRDRFKVQETTEPLTEQPKKELKRLSGDITSIKERLQSLEKQQSLVNDGNGASKTTANKLVDIPVPPLKERLSSLQNAVTKEEVRKPPVVLVDARQLEIMKSEEEKAQMNLKETKKEKELETVNEIKEKVTEANKTEDIKSEVEEIDRDDSGIHTADDIEVEEKVQADIMKKEQELKLNAAIEALAKEEKQLSEAANAVNQIEAEFEELSIGSVALPPLANNQNGAAAQANITNDHMEYSINEALELALEAIDKESTIQQTKQQQQQQQQPPQQQLQQQPENSYPITAQYNNNIANTTTTTNISNNNNNIIINSNNNNNILNVTEKETDIRENFENLKESDILLNKTDEEKCEKLKLEESYTSCLEIKQKSEEEISKEPIYENITKTTTTSTQQEVEPLDEARSTSTTITTTATIIPSMMNINQTNSSDSNLNNQNPNQNQNCNENLKQMSTQNSISASNQLKNSQITKFNCELSSNSNISNNLNNNSNNNLNKQPQQQNFKQNTNNINELTNAFANTTITTSATSKIATTTSTTTAISSDNINSNNKQTTTFKEITFQHLEQPLKPQTTTTTEIEIISQTTTEKPHEIMTTSSLQNTTNDLNSEPYYQVPKSSEPYYDAPKHLKPVPVYENIEIFFNGNLTTELSGELPPNLQPPKEKPPPPPVDSPPLFDDVDSSSHTDTWSSDNTYETLSRHQLNHHNHHLSPDHPSPPIKRMNSTKRIKKELRNKRSSFLGIEGSSMDDDESYLELTVAPPPDMAQLLQEERRLEKQLYLKAGLCDSSDTGESRDSGVSENHSRQSSEHYTNSSEENETHDDTTSPLTLQTQTALDAPTPNDMIYQNDGLLAVVPTPLLQTVKGNSAESWTESATVAAAATQSLTEATATANAKMMSIEEKIREQEEVLRVERELLQLEQEELKRQRENLMLRENMARRELQHGAKMLMSANRRSLQDLNGLGNMTVVNIAGDGTLQDMYHPQMGHNMPQHMLSQPQLAQPQQQPQQQQQQFQSQQIYANIPNLQQQYYHMENDYRKSMSDINEFSKRMMSQPPPAPPSKPMRAMHINTNTTVNGIMHNGPEHTQDYAARQRHSLNSQNFGGSLVKIANAPPTAAPRANPHIYSNYHHQSVQNLSTTNQNPQQLPNNGVNPSLYPGNMSRNTLHALSATPKPKYTDGWVQVQQRKSYDSNLANDPAWLSAYQQKRKSMPDTYHGYNQNNHWLVQEAEQRRLSEQQQQQRRTVSSNNTPIHQSGNINGKMSNGSALSSSSTNGKPLPDSIIQTLTERVQSKGIGERKRTNMDKSPLHAASSYHQYQQQYNTKLNPQQQPTVSSAVIHRHTNNMISTTSSASTTAISSSTTTTSISQGQSNITTSQQQQDKVLSVSGKKKCSHCGDELGRGAAMIIESLLLFYHINCFKCCVCHVQLGDGLNGTDVRVRNHKLHCQNCYSSDDGIKFSCV